MAFFSSLRCRRLASVAMLIGLVGLSTSATGAAEATPAEQPAAAVVNGFRSASFGMTEAQVIAAIQKDFKVNRPDIAVEQNKIERTTSISVTVPDLLPDTGKAKVAYILGHKSRTLIQVNVGWGAVAGLPSTAEQILGTAQLLKSYLLGAGYDPQKSAVDSVLPDGSVMLFRGITPQGPATILTLSGPVEQNGDKKTLTPAALSLSYISNPGNPDIYRIPKGQF